MKPTTIKALDPERPLSTRHSEPILQSSLGLRQPTVGQTSSRKMHDGESIRYGYDVRLRETLSLRKTSLMNLADSEQIAPVHCNILSHGLLLRRGRSSGFRNSHVKSYIPNQPHFVRRFRFRGLDRFTPVTYHPRTARKLADGLCQPWNSVWTGDTTI